MRWIFLAIGMVLVPAAIFAQQNRKCKWIKEYGVPVDIDSLTLIPSTIQITGKADSSIDIRYDPATGKLILETDKKYDSLQVCYQTFPYKLNEVYQKRSVSDYLENNRYKKPQEKKAGELAGSREELFPTERIQKSGSLSRGISFGNTQNVVLNSTLNLQMEGKLSDNLNIRASITDRDVPYQPEGNTAQIQDFDNILMELYNDHFSLKGGDVVLKNKPSAFLRYNKNVQGGMISASYRVSKKSEAQSSLGISVAKGKFATIQLEVQEGVSGPYRIRVPGTNEFIIILANSEKVYLDGKLLARGYDNDYVIDYNKAEIQFTSRVLITKFSRVRIDVEYSDRNYSRSVIAANHYQEVGRVNFFFNYYSEKDNKNRPLTFPLTDRDKMLLSRIGDNLEEAVTISAEETAYTPDLILYEKRDTVDVASQHHQIFVYSNNPDTVLYRVAFNKVGEGRGDYVLVPAALNGNVYQWVSPQGGVHQGDYAPVSRIPVPNMKNMITLGGGVKISNYEKVYTEMAFSKNDLNLYSRLDSYDNNGKAFKVGYLTEKRPVGFLKGYFLTAGLNYEYDDAFFVPVDRFRYIEFDRDWNYNHKLSGDKTADNIFNLLFGIEKDAQNKINYKLTKRYRGQYVDGYQNVLELYKQLGRFQLASDAFFMSNNTAFFHSKWSRANLDLNYRSRYLVPGYTYKIDRNVIYDPEEDSVTGSAMNYAEHVFYIRSNDTLKTRFGASYSIREDRSPLQGEMEKSNRSRTTRFFVRSRFNGNQDLNVLFTYRNNLNYLADKGPLKEETVITRIDWYARFFKSHVRSDLSYAIGNGRELKREFVFVQTATGEGTHTWRDDNGDGIQDLTEFYLAINPDEKNYIKIFIPSAEYVFAYENNFNYRLNIDMPHNWRREEGFKKFLSRFSNSTSFTQLKRITNPDLLSRFLPFYFKIPEEDILSVRQSIRSRLFFNQSDPGFGMDVGVTRTGNKQLLTNGFEEHQLLDYTSSVRINLGKSYNLKLFMDKGKTTSSSDFLSGRNYIIDRYKVAPEISWQPKNTFRLSLQYAYSGKKNIIEDTGGETSDAQEIVMALKYNRILKHTLTARVRFIDINYDGVENSPVGYEMLEALRPGRNLTWNLIFQKKIINGLQLSANYEGRKSEGSGVVHIGRMQVSALF